MSGTLILDFDMVIADLHSEWVRQYNRFAGTDHQPEDIDHWDWPLSVEHPELMWALLQRRRPSIYAGVKPIPGAIDGLRAITDAGIPWVIATSLSTLDQLEEKLEWLARHDVVPYGSQFTEYLIPIKKKYLLQGAVMVDDAPHNLEGFPGKRILFDAPHNRSVELEGAHRAKGWPELVEMLLATPELMDGTP